jgi:hypothetical protein
MRRTTLETLENVLATISELSHRLASEEGLHAEGNKAAGVRARAASLALEKNLKVYRKLSVAKDVK